VSKKDLDDAVGTRHRPSAYDAAKAALDKSQLDWASRGSPRHRRCRGLAKAQIGTSWAGFGRRTDTVSTVDPSVWVRSASRSSSRPGEQAGSRAAEAKIELVLSDGASIRSRASSHSRPAGDPRPAAELAILFRTPEHAAAGQYARSRGHEHDPGAVVCAARPERIAGQLPGGCGRC